MIYSMKKYNFLPIVIWQLLFFLGNIVKLEKFKKINKKKNKYINLNYKNKYFISKSKSVHMKTGRK